MGKKWLFLPFVLSFWCDSLSVIWLGLVNEVWKFSQLTRFLHFCCSSCDTTNQKGTNLSTCIWNTTVWTATIGCWGWCAVVWRSGQSMQDTSKPRPASFPASAQREPARGLMSEEQTTMDRWPTLWRLNRWVGSFGYAAKDSCWLYTFKKKKK